MPLSDDHVRAIAQLARLSLRDDERETIRHQLDQVLDYVGQLAQVNLAGVEPLAHPLDAQNAFRTDDLTASLPAHSALANGPDTRGDFFIVPAVFESHSS